MGSTNFGNQTQTVKYHDPVTSYTVNRLFEGLLPRGIYSGGYLTVNSPSAASISPALFLIGDDNYTLKVATAETVVLTVDTTNKVIVLRWVYVADETLDWVDFLAVAPGSVQENDLVIGVCQFTAGSLVGFDYGDAANPRTESNFINALKVEPTPAASMAVMVKGGFYQTTSIVGTLRTQKSSTLTAPVSNPRYAGIYIATDGTVKVVYGAEAASPVYPNLPNGAMVILAMIYQSVGMTGISVSNIKDVRPSVGRIG